MGKSQPPTTPPHQRRASFGQRWSVLDTFETTMNQPTPSWRNEKRNSHERGYGVAWQRARRGYLMSHPLCVMCTAEGLTTAAEVVDHIKPHRGDQGLFWDQSNWQSLCKQHHDSDKARQEHGTRERAKFDPKGRVVW